MTIKELDSGDGSLSAEAAADGSSQMQQSNSYFIRGPTFLKTFFDKDKKVGLFHHRR